MSRIKLMFASLLVFAISCSGPVKGESPNTNNGSEMVKIESPASIPVLTEERPKSLAEVVTWKIWVDQKGCEATIYAKAEVKDHWHIYSITHDIEKADFTGTPTKFTFAPSSSYSLVGGLKEKGTPEIINDDLGQHKWFEGGTTFSQKIKILNKNDFKVSFEYDFQVCDDQGCLFPDAPFKGTVDLKGCSEGSDVDEEETPEDTELEDTTMMDSSMVEVPEILEHWPGPIEFSVLSYRKEDFKYEVQLRAKLEEGWMLVAGGKGNDIKIDWLKSDAFEFDSDFVLPEAKEMNGWQIYDSTVVFSRLLKVSDTSELPKVLSKVEFYAINGDSLVKSVVVADQEEQVMEADLNNSIDSRSNKAYSSLWQLFVIAFGSGLIALLTPCVFPMIPMTVTFFTKQSKTRAEGIKKATIYSLSIILIYVILGVVFSKSLGPDALNAMSTSAVANIIFFVLFVVFALSFFGAFEIRIPSGLINKADKQADKGGLLGIFFMAFTLALVSFSCTGPVVGTVLVESASGGVTAPIVAMLGFSLALALPFGLFAAFPGWLNSLPQSGGWLNTVKVVLAFFELAFALKFLSTADTAYQWHLLEREIYVALWMAIFLCLGLYLIGKIRFSHDSPMEYVPVGRAMFAIIVFSFVLYLTPGLWNGGELKMVNAYLPPSNYAENAIAVYHGDDSGHDKENMVPLPPSASQHGHGITVIKEYDEALEYARQVGKPLLIDFTGWACVNCRRMEKNVWVAPDVVSYMRDSVVIASLYVDEKTSLPEKDRFFSKALDKEITTVGGKFMHLSSSRYGEVTQPLYVLVDHNENQLIGNADYENHGDVERFSEWIGKGMQNFDKVKNVKIYKPEVELAE